MKLAAILTLVIVPALSAAEPALEKSAVLSPKLNGITRDRILGVVVAAMGTVLSHCEVREHDSTDWCETEVHLRRSTDDGVIWNGAVEITASCEFFRRNIWKVYPSGRGQGMQMKSGRLVVPNWFAYGGTEDHKPSSAATIPAKPPTLTSPCSRTAQCSVSSSARTPLTAGDSI